MRSRTGKLLVVFLGLLLAGTAVAQVKPIEEPEVVPGVQILDFVKTPPIVGELVKPANSYIQTKPDAEFPLQIRVRGDFLPEMMKTVSSL